MTDRADRPDVSTDKRTFEPDALTGPEYFALRTELAILKQELRRREAAMELALRALVMSSPHTDALYRWQDAAWRAQRAEAIRALQPPARSPH